MRRGFNGLAAQVQTVLQADPFSGHLFLFRGRRGGRVTLCTLLVRDQAAAWSYLADNLSGSPVALP
jgi:transposase